VCVDKRTGRQGQSMCMISHGRHYIYVYDIHTYINAYMHTYIHIVR
jgi:hypothetical protein